MSDYSGLVERLRGWWTAWGAPMDRDECVNEGCMAMDCNEAAAAIEALVVEVERLKQYAPMPGGTPMGFVTRDLKIEAQRERIERLEGALVIAERQLALIAAKFARAALEAKS